VESHDCVCGTSPAVEAFLAIQDDGPNDEAGPSRSKGEAVARSVLRRCRATAEPNYERPYPSDARRLYRRGS